MKQQHLQRLSEVELEHLSDESQQLLLSRIQQWEHNASSTQNTEEPAIGYPIIPERHTTLFDEANTSRMIFWFGASLFVVFLFVVTDIVQIPVLKQTPPTQHSQIHKKKTTVKPSTRPSSQPTSAPTSRPKPTPDVQR